MPNQSKITKLEILKDKVQKAKSLTFVDYLGLKVNEINDLRDKIREKDAETLIAKNTLMRVALEESGISDERISSNLKGPSAMILAYNDPISPLKTIFDFAKKAELPKVKFSVIEGVFSSKEEVEKISSLPSKEQLIHMTLLGFKSPLSGFINLLSGTNRKFVTVISKIAEGKK